MRTSIRPRATAIVIAGALLVAAGFTQDVAKNPAKPRWFARAEQSLLGTWMNTNPDTQSIPKLDVLLKDDALKVRFWGRTSPEDRPFGPPDNLLVLAPRSDVEVPTKPEATAFAMHKADFALKYFTLKLNKGVIHLEGVTIFTDDSRRSDRIYVATFRKR